MKVLFSCSPFPPSLLLISAQLIFPSSHSDTTFVYLFSFIDFNLPSFLPLLHPSSPSLLPSLPSLFMFSFTHTQLLPYSTTDIIVQIVSIFNFPSFPILPLPFPSSLSFHFISFLFPFSFLSLFPFIPSHSFDTRTFPLFFSLPCLTLPSFPLLFICISLLLPHPFLLTFLYSSFFFLFFLLT